MNTQQIEVKVTINLTVTEDTEEDAKVKAECLVEEALDQLTEVDSTYDIEEINLN